MSLTSGIGNYFSTRLLNLLMGGQSFSPPATWYAALLTTNPSDDDGTGLVEVTGGSYARVLLNNNTSNFPSSSVVSHVATMLTGSTITWPTATASWGTVTGVAFYDASSGGNLGFWAPLQASQAVGSGSTFFVSSGNGTFTQG